MASQATTLTWAQTAALNPDTTICLSCGARLDPPLAWLASLRCHDCRDSRAPISPQHVFPLAPHKGGLSGKPDKNHEQTVIPPPTAANRTRDFRTSQSRRIRSSVPAVKP